MKTYVASMTREQALAIVLGYARDAYPSEDFIASLDIEKNRHELNAIAELHDAIALLEDEL
jgi:hypothetical protein